MFWSSRCSITSRRVGSACTPARNACATVRPERRIANGDVSRVATTCPLRRVHSDRVVGRAKEETVEQHVLRRIDVEAVARLVGRDLPEPRDGDTGGLDDRDGRVLSSEQRDVANADVRRSRDVDRGMSVFQEERRRIDDASSTDDDVAGVRDVDRALHDRAGGDIDRRVARNTKDVVPRYRVHPRARRPSSAGRVGDVALEGLSKTWTFLRCPHRPRTRRSSAAGGRTSPSSRRCPRRGDAVGHWTYPGAGHRARRLRDLHFDWPLGLEQTIAAMERVSRSTGAW